MVVVAVQVLLFHDPVDADCSAFGRHEEHVDLMSTNVGKS